MQPDGPVSELSFRIEESAVTYRCDNRSDATSPSRANSENTSNDVHDSSNQGDHICDEHPLADLLIYIQPILDLLRKDACSASPVQVPDLHWVEPEIGLAIRALCQLDSVGAVLASRAVVPQIDLIDIVEWRVTAGRNEVINKGSKFRVDFVQGRCEASGGCYVVFEIRGIGLITQSSAVSMLSCRFFRLTLK